MNHICFAEARLHRVRMSQCASIFPSGSGGEHDNILRFFLSIFVVSVVCWQPCCHVYKSGPGCAPSRSKVRKRIPVESHVDTCTNPSLCPGADCCLAPNAVRNRWLMHRLTESTPCSEDCRGWPGTARAVRQHNWISARCKTHPGDTRGQGSAAYVTSL